MRSPKQTYAYITLILTFFCWGSVYVGGKMVGDVPAPLVAGLRCLTAVFPLMLMARKKAVPVAREDWKYFVLIGGLGYFLTIVLIQEGISRTGASMAALINSLTPVGVTICAAIVLKERITPVKIFCLFLALSGTWIITAGVSERGELLGVLLVVLSVFTWSLSSVFMRKLTAQYPPIQVTAYGMAISLVFHVPTSAFSVISRGGSGLTPMACTVILYLGLIGSGFAQFTWTTSLSRIPASTCSLFYPLQPAFAALLGALLLGERFAPTFFIGMALIGGDVLLCAWETKQLERT